MILGRGKWQGRGSYRPTTESLALRFQASIAVEDDQRTEGLVANATLQVEGGSPRSLLVYVVADDVGTYTVTVTGEGIDIQGTAKLDSEPNLAFLWSEDGTMHVTSAVFTLPDTHGVRGFARVRKDTWTWELAIEPQHRIDRGRPQPRPSGAKDTARGKVVSLLDRLKR